MDTDGRALLGEEKGDQIEKRGIALFDNKEWRFIGKYLSWGCGQRYDNRGGGRNIREGSLNRFLRFATNKGDGVWKWIFKGAQSGDSECVVPENLGSDLLGKVRECVCFIEISHPRIVANSRDWGKR